MEIISYFLFIQLSDNLWMW